MLTFCPGSSERQYNELNKSSNSRDYVEVEDTNPSIKRMNLSEKYCGESWGKTRERQ